MAVHRVEKARMRGVRVTPSCTRRLIWRERVASTFSDSICSVILISYGFEWIEIDFNLLWI